MTTPASLTSTTVPEQSPPAYCVDEDILVRCTGDYATLCPAWQVMASGSDGSFSSGTPWVLSSATVNFANNGVNPGMVVQLTKQSVFPGIGRFCAIDSISTNTVTLRLPHKDLNVGQPPGVGGVTGVNFVIATMDQQIEEASFELKRRYGIDESIPYRASSWVFDERDLRMATVLTVLKDRYISESRTRQGDFEEKIRRIEQELVKVLDRVQIRWGPFGNSAEPSTLFSCQIARG